MVEKSYANELSEIKRDWKVYMLETCRSCKHINSTLLARFPVRKDADDYRDFLEKRENDQKTS